VLVLLHGVAKLRGGVDPIVGMLTAAGLPGFIAYGAYLGEVLGPLMLIAGFHARIGALLVLVNMLFAVGLAHMAQLGMLNEQGGWALELQGMFIGTAVAVVLLGPGRFSVNGK
jgi:putative oxidoreductase